MSDLMFPKNTKKRKRKTAHRTNARLPIGVKCAICGKQATETHELRGGPYRNISIECGFQLKLCHHCHHVKWPKMTKHEKGFYRLSKQKQIMIENGWLEEDWLEVFNKSYLRED